MVSLNLFIALGIILFFIGLLGVLIRRNIVIIMISVEIMLNAVNILLVAFNRYKFIENNDGLTYSFFIIAVAAAEASVGLAILIAVYRKRKTVFVNKLNTMSN